MLDPLAAIRAIHFASAMVIAGAAAFSVLVAEPVWQGHADAAQPVAAHRKHVAHLIWLGLATAFASGLVWLVLVAVDIANEPWSEVIGDGTAWTVFTETQFGFVFQLRLLLMFALVGLLLLSARRQDGAPDSLRVVIALIAAGLLGSLAWTGHAGGASGAGANVHLLADIFHLLAGGIWIGGLAPLALLMARLSQAEDGRSLAVCARVVRRFSNVGVITVAALAVSGAINTWFLTDHLRGLIGTDYGQILLVKIGLFLAMICLAADNRLRLLPRLARSEDQSNSPARALSLRHLRRNTAFEIALGLAVLYVVGVLGMTPPAGHVHGACIEIGLVSRSLAS